MDDEEREIAALKQKSGIPMNMESLSLTELDQYQSLLEGEMQRLKEEKQRKNAHREASALNFFKS